MGNVAMILKRSPYGDINAAEAVRHALGAVSFEMSVDLILMDGGVLLAKKGQDDAGTGFTNLGRNSQGLFGDGRISLCRRCFTQSAACRIE